MADINPFDRDLEFLFDDTGSETLFGSSLENQQRFGNPPQDLDITRFLQPPATSRGRMIAPSQNPKMPGVDPQRMNPQTLLKLLNLFIRLKQLQMQG